MEDPHEFRYFDLVDYSIFALLLFLSSLIGVYFAFCAKQKQNTTAEYLMGGRKMGIFPISMSLIASYISGIALIGLPAEMYVYGTQLWMLILPEFFTHITMAIVFIPVFYKLQITSSYEYLRKRFNKTVRTLGSLLFLVKMMLYIPIVIYVPALSFAQVTGFSLHLLIPIVCVVCIFYTTLGGIKAVVWTDTLQMMLMLLGVITVLVMGTYDVGGFQAVWKRSEQGERLEFFNLDPDFTVRHTFWNILVGKFFQHLASCTVNQAMVQRCLAMPTLSKARITIVIFAIGISSLVSMCCYTGLVLYAAFYDCDPITTHQISKPDQLLPYFVMKVTSHVPGLPGIFLSGVFSAALSTMSTGLNSMTGVILEDFIRPMCKKPISEARASFIMKVIVVVLGVICIGLAFVVAELGSGIIQTASSLAGITAGTLLGIFALGMLFPWANSTGALIGGIVSFSFVAWIAMGTQVAISRHEINFPTKPVSTEGCGNLTTSLYLDWLNTTTPAPIQQPNPPFPLYTISYNYYTTIGAFTVIVVGLLVSFLTGPKDPRKMEPNLFSPVIHKYLNTDMQFITNQRATAKKDSYDVRMGMNGLGQDKSLLKERSRN